jgi:hypothetical protein
MTERWRRELARVDEISPDIDHIRWRTGHPPLSHTRVEPRRSRLMAGVTAVVVFILAVSLYVIPAVRGPNGSPSAIPSGSQTAYPFFVPGAPRSAATAEANKLLRLTYVPPGSQPRNHSPIRATNYPLGGSTSCAVDPCRYSIHRTRWWLVPLPLHTVLSELESHPPAGLSLEYGPITGSITGAISWSYVAGPSPVYSRAELELAIGKWGADKTVLRADSGVLWVPPRTPAERLPDEVNTVQLASYKGDAVIARTTASGDAASQLAAVFNHLGRINMGPPSCPFDGKNAKHYTMRFATSNGTFTFAEWFGCSPGDPVFVKIDGNTQPALASALQLVAPGAGGSSLVGPIESYVECLLNQETDCRLWLGPDPLPTDPVGKFCAGVHLLEDWLATDVAQTEDESALAAAVKGHLSGMEMWFVPDEQQITDPQIRTDADRIVDEALAMQTWTSSSGTSFNSKLDAFNSDASAFVSDYCG